MMIQADPSILQATPIHVEEGLRPYRYVLRLVTGMHPYVIHRENLTLCEGVWMHEEFYWGHYFLTQESAKKEWEKRFPPMDTGHFYQEQRE